MFSIVEIRTGTGTVQYRRELLTGFRCRISTERIRRCIDQEPPIAAAGEADCPFCPGKIEGSTPRFPDGSRICRGESTTFPNLYPFAAFHTVTVISRAHSVARFSPRQLSDALHGQLESLRGYDGYASINWNYLPSAGASLAHPHMQGVADALPTSRAERYITESHRHRLATGRIYWDELREHEADSERYLFGKEIPWIASAVPVGEKEIRALLPIRTADEFGPYIETFAADLLRILDLYREAGTHAFNMSLFFDRKGYDSGFRAFCSIIARINPNPSSISDSAFMERLHLEPLILTLPEDIGRKLKR
ncbi:MAG: galactose-1-phosphate uridylyltransferase [Methanoculleus sp. SDB]|nr:MAG: galactose-1-phosphate uridylyltransferase [Methanoculleus sp. SDB]